MQTRSHRMHAALAAVAIVALLPAALPAVNVGACLQACRRGG